jgi:hypothetical protein
MEDLKTLYSLGAQANQHHAETLAILNGQEHGIPYPKVHITNLSRVNKHVLYHLQRAIQTQQVDGNSDASALHANEAADYMKKYVSGINSLHKSAKENRYSSRTNYPTPVWADHLEKSRGISSGINAVSKNMAAKRVRG